MAAGEPGGQPMSTARFDPMAGLRAQNAQGVVAGVPHRPWPWYPADMTVADTSKTLVVAMGADHAGVALKALLREALEEAGHQVLDLGTNGPESVDYPDFGAAVAEAVAAGKARLGVLVCGTGIGISMAANRNPAIRCALIHDVTGARLTRQHNDANVIAFGARMTGPEVALDALRAFIDTPFEGGRHCRRVEKLSPGWSPSP